MPENGIQTCSFAHCLVFVPWCGGMGGSYKYTEGFIKDDQSMFGAAGRNKMAEAQTVVLEKVPSEGS